MEGEDHVAWQGRGQGYAEFGVGEVLCLRGFGFVSAFCAFWTDNPSKDGVRCLAGETGRLASPGFVSLPLLLSLFLFIIDDDDDDNNSYTQGIHICIHILT